MMKVLTEKHTRQILLSGCIYRARKENNISEIYETKDTNDVLNSFEKEGLSYINEKEILNGIKTTINYIRHFRKII